MIRIAIRVLVAVLGLLVCFRLITGPPKPEGLVVMTNLKPNDINEHFFSLRSPTPLLISATGSVDQRSGASGLGATAWIYSESAEEPVWNMQDTPLTAGQDGLRHVESDRIVLPPGDYAAYFASYGQLLNKWWDPPSRERRAWKFVVRTEDEGATTTSVRHEDSNIPAVWSETRMEDGERYDYVFEVVRTTPVTIKATGEVPLSSSESPRDFAAIEHVSRGRQIWSLTAADSEPAGGHAYNRRYRGTIMLVPGFYRATAVTDRRHSAERWRSNPPWDPYFWGVQITAEDPSAIRIADPWESRDPIISFMRVGNDQDIEQRFEVTREVVVVLYSVGEITRGGSRWDYAWLEQERDGEQQMFWSMNEDNTKHAGGGSKNRYAHEFLTLTPGTYTLYYKSDGSHSWEVWNEFGPDHPERWGVTLFPAARSLPAGVIRLLDY